MVLHDTHTHTQDSTVFGGGGDVCVCVCMCVGGGGCVCGRVVTMATMNWLQVTEAILHWVCSQHGYAVFVA